MATVVIPRGGLVGRGGEEPKGEQRVWPAATAGAGKVEAWLHNLKARRYDVFVGMKPV